MSIRIEAERCVGSAQGVGFFGIDDLVVAIEVVELGYRLWQSCSAASSATEATAAAGMTLRESKNFRRARRRNYVAAKRKHVDMSTKNLDGMTTHMLNHINQAEAVSLGVCCSEPTIQDEVND